MKHIPQDLRAELRKYSPLLGDVHVATPAANMMVAYTQAREDLIRPRICNPVKVNKLTGKIGKIDKGKWAANSAGQQKIALGAAIPHGEYDMSLGDYSCEKYAWGKKTPRELRNNNSLPMPIDRADSEYVIEQILMGLELDLQSVVFATGTWGSGTDWAGAASENLGSQQFKYWNTSSSTPIDNMSLLNSTIRTRIRRKPNTVIFGDRVEAALKANSQMRGMFPGASEIMITPEVIARHFGVKRALVGLASYNAAVPGQADDMADVWGRSIWIGYVDENPSLNSPTALSVIQYTGEDMGPMVEGVQAMVDYDKRTQQFITEGVTYTDHVMVAADAGILVTGIVESTY